MTASTSQPGGLNPFAPSEVEWPRPARTLALIVALTFLGTLIRVLAASNELWVDELFSWLTAGTASPWSDNHPLIAVWFTLVGWSRSELVYRMPSVVAGALCIPLVASVAGTTARARLIAAALATTSYWLVLLGSEARGYALAMFLALAAHRLTARLHARPGIAVAGALAVCSTLGLLSHLSFVFVQLALLVWTGARARGRLLWQLPGAAVLLFAVVRLRGTTVSGPPASVPSSFVGFLARVAGATQPPWEWIAASVVLAVFLWQLYWDWRAGESDAPFFAALAVAPLGAAVGSALLSHAPVYPRFFAVTAPFVLVILARTLARPPVPRAMGALVAAALVVAGLRLDSQLIRLGREHASDGFRFLLSQTPLGPVTLGSDIDIRVELSLAFYGPRIPGGDRVHFVERSAADPAPDWWVLTLSEPTATGTDAITRRQARYERQRVWGYADSSGLTWVLYRRAP